MISPPCFLDYAVRDAHTETGALPGRFGREEGIEDFSAVALLIPLPVSRMEISTWSFPNAFVVIETLRRLQWPARRCSKYS